MPTFAMIGTGKQAITQVAAVLAVRSVRRIRVFSRDQTRRDLFADRLRSEFHVEVVSSSSVREAVAGASIVTVATRASDPIVSSDMLLSGAHINSVGAIVPSRSEVAQDVLLRCTQIATDSVLQAQKLSREMIEFFGNDVQRWSAVKPLARIVADRVTRHPSDDLTLFKALGVGISDLSLGIELYLQAVSSGLGYRFAPPQRISPRLTREAKQFSH
jgi:alanine dehydrogenase